MEVLFGFDVNINYQLILVKRFLYLVVHLKSCCSRRAGIGPGGPDQKLSGPDRFYFMYYLLSLHRVDTGVASGFVGRGPKVAPPGRDAGKQ